VTRPPRGSTPPTRRCAKPNASSPNKPKRPTREWSETGRLPHQEKRARARHRSAHIDRPSKGKPRGRLKAPDVCASLRQSLAPEPQPSSRRPRRQLRRLTAGRDCRYVRPRSRPAAPTEPPTEADLEATPSTGAPRNIPAALDFHPSRQRDRQAPATRTIAWPPKRSRRFSSEAGESSRPRLAPRTQASRALRRPSHTRARSSLASTLSTCAVKITVDVPKPPLDSRT